MYHPCGWNKYSHHSKLIKTRFYCQQLWNAIIYCCYCIVFVDLICIFGYFLFCIKKIAVLSKFHSTDFVSIHAYAFDAPVQFYTTLFNTQRCSVAFNKPNRIVVACQLTSLSYSQQLINMD